MSPWQREITFEHNTHISGSAYVSFTKPHRDAFVVHTCQQMPTATYRQWNDIALKCRLNSNALLHIWEELPNAMSFIRFTGEMSNCKRKIVGGNVVTLCIYVLLD